MNCDCCGQAEATNTTSRMGDTRSTCDHCYRNCIVGKSCTKTGELRQPEPEPTPQSPPTKPKVPESLSEWF
jgi:hypothetical protein